MARFLRIAPPPALRISNRWLVMVGRPVAQAGRPFQNDNNTMPMNSPNDSGDPYEDGAPTDSRAAPPQDQSPDAQETDTPDDGQPVAVLPKSILAGKDFQPGDELVLKITAIHDDEVQVEYAPSKDQESNSGQAQAQAPDEMGSMME